MKFLAAYAAAGMALLMTSATNVASDVNDEAARKILCAGVYELSYLGFDVGDESFTIYETPEGYEAHARLTMRKGDQPSSEGVYYLDEERRVTRAEYRELDNPEFSAVYEVDGDELVARRLEKDRVIEESRFELGEGDIVTGPHYLTDFFVLAPKELERGETASMRALAFGFKDWTVSEVELEIKRENNRVTDSPTGDRFDAEVVRSWIRTPSNTYRTRSFLDDRGVSNRITIERSIGYVDIRLRASDEEVLIESPTKEGL